MPAADSHPVHDRASMYCTSLATRRNQSCSRSSSCSWPSQRTGRRSEGRDLFLLCYDLHSHAKSDTWALQVCNHLSGVEGSQLYTYRYVDYIGTCPLLTLTLCATLNLPYKLTSAIFMLLVIVAGLMAFWSPAPGRYVWFGLGCVIFAFTWYRIVTLSQVRFLQYFGKKHRITYRVGNSQKSKRRESFATKAGLRDKRVRGPIQMFLGTYFIVWTGEAWMLATDQAGET